MYTDTTTNTATKHVHRRGMIESVLFFSRVPVFVTGTETGFSATDKDKDSD